MDAAPLLVAGGAAVGVLGVLGVRVATSRAWLAGRRARRVVVHLADDRSVEGLLATVAADGLVLRAATYLGESGNVAMAGELFVGRSQVVMVQVIGEPPKVDAPPNR